MGRQRRTRKKTLGKSRKRSNGGGIGASIAASQKKKGRY